MCFGQILASEQITNSKNGRVADHKIHKVILNRWSPRAMSGEALSRNELMSLFEAARWAPSSYNDQPWKFIYATRDNNDWKTFLELLVPFNQSWACNAGVLILVISSTLFERNKKKSKTHAFDAGAAWQNLALQGSSMGLVVHAMEGFNYEMARKKLNIPDTYDIHAIIAVGKPGKLEVLPKDMQEDEKPSQRKPINEIAYKGKFPQAAKKVKKKRADQ
jgi:nitroreductase